MWFAFKKLYLWLDKQLVYLFTLSTSRCDLLSKNCIFDLINNAEITELERTGLWFAFKKLYLWLDKQPSSTSIQSVVSCDLLSKNCIFDLINNCLLRCLCNYMLWFAFKKLYLWLDKQLNPLEAPYFCRCDLLSKNCIFDLINNILKILLSFIVLWFAFKKLYLWLDKQLHYFEQSDLSSCDLLSKNCIFDLINNIIFGANHMIELWFAFKKLYLWLDKQLCPVFVPIIISCDLLSKNCIFDLINNFET